MSGNMPSGSVYGKLIKKVFKAPEGYLIAGSDHSSLQGRTGACITNDPALIKIYSEDVDLHSYMLVRYRPEMFEKDHPETAEWYDWVRTTYPKERSSFKGVTFALIASAFGW